MRLVLLIQPNTQLRRIKICGGMSRNGLVDWKYGNIFNNILVFERKINLKDDCKYRHNENGVYGDVFPRKRNES